MSTSVVKGICPECEFEFETPVLVVGETLACPECLLALQVRGINDDRLELAAVETALDDWGQ